MATTFNKIAADQAMTAFRAAMHGDFNKIAADKQALAALAAFGARFPEWTIGVWRSREKDVFIEYRRADNESWQRVLVDYSGNIIQRL